MIRRIINIDKNKCNGCGICVDACHEDAIGIIDGKATLLRDDYCDGLGDCLPTCPTSAISFIEKDTLEYDEAAVKINMQKKAEAIRQAQENPLPCGCPGTQAKAIKHNMKISSKINKKDDSQVTSSRLNQWPVQIKLVNPKAPYLNDSSLLIAADCTAYAYGDFHNKFIKNNITLIGCPKLDEGDYSEKLAEILKLNSIKNITIVRMEVPCCGGIVTAVKTALEASGKLIPWQIVTISTDGSIIE
jgi:ferredoxin